MRNELLWYAKRRHAKIVYWKCIKAGKLKTATKIAFNYDLQVTGVDDTVMATGLAAMFNQ